MEKVKVINIKTKVIKEINENLVNEYLGTGEYKIFKEIILLKRYHKSKQ